MNFEKWKNARWYPNTVAICSGVLMYFLLQHVNIVGSLVGGLWKTISPLVLALVLAYLVNPLAMFFESHVVSKALANLKESSRWKISVFSAILSLIAIICLLLLALIPQLLSSILTFLETFSDNIVSLEMQLNTIAQNLNQNGINLSSLNQAINTALETLSGLIANGDFLTKSQQFGSSMSNFVIGFVLAIYFLMDKKNLINTTSHLFRKILDEKTYESTARFIRKCNGILIRYTTCTLLEGIIVGCVNALFMLIFRLPYIPVVSIVVGVTNLAPTFGPIVGCIIGMFILLLSKPVYAVYFLLFTLILQTIDGYVIKPRLFGNTLGVSPLLILISIVIGGRLFGVIGILFAIPFSAIAEYGVKEFLFSYNRENEQTENIDTETDEEIPEDHRSGKQRNQSPRKSLLLRAKEFVRDEITIRPEDEEDTEETDLPVVPENPPESSDSDDFETIDTEALRKKNKEESTGSES